MSVWSGTRDIGAASIAVRDQFAALRRDLPLLAVWVLICVGLGVVHLRTTTPQYMTSTQVVLQPRHVAVGDSELLRQSWQVALDDEQAASQLQVIRSERLLRSVFDGLHLANDAELHGARIGMLARLDALLSRLTGDRALGTPDQEAFANFMSRVRARRLGLSYVIDIAYRSASPEQAVRVANAIASAYLRSRIDSVAADAAVAIPHLRKRMMYILGESLAARDATLRGAVSQDYLADADVRLLGPAPLPLGVSSPHRNPILVFCFGSGLLSGVLGILLRHRTDRRIWSRRVLSERLGLPVLATVEATPWSWRRGGRRRGRRRADIRTALRAARFRRSDGPDDDVMLVTWRQADIAARLAALLAGHDEPLAVASGATAMPPDSLPVRLCPPLATLGTAGLAQHRGGSAVVVVRAGDPGADVAACLTCCRGAGVRVLGAAIVHERALGRGAARRLA